MFTLAKTFNFQLCLPKNALLAKFLETLNLPKMESFIQECEELQASTGRDGI